MLSLKPVTQNIRSARSFAADLLDTQQPDVRDTVVLLVSELVSNAVQHGGPYGAGQTVDLEVDVGQNRVRVEVTDVGASDPRPGNGEVDHPSGRGLVLVEALASRWGYHRASVGKTVWFELLKPARGDADG